MATRLPPGALSLAAARTAREQGFRAASVFLLGAFTAEVAVTLALLAGMVTLPADMLQSEIARHAAPSVGLAAAGLVLLWPFSAKPRRPCLWQGSATAAAGFGLALSTPGLWSWWVSVGAVILASGIKLNSALAVGAAMAAGLATSHILFLLGVRFLRPTLPQWSRIIRLPLGVILIVAAVFLAIRSLV